MKNLGNLMRQAQEMQSRMADVQTKLAEAVIDGQSGGGMVRVVMNGKGEVKKLKIEPSLCSPGDVEVLEDLVVAALGDAKAKSEAMVAEEMGKVTGGLSLPPGLKLPF
jgi:DNA-binding YbaB/EbfC family protein